jgi:hypothetical protein
MARLAHAGAELYVGGTAAQNTGPDGNVAGTSITRDTSVFRSGVASWKGGFAAPQPHHFRLQRLTITYFFRIYIRVAARRLWPGHLRSDGNLHDGRAT